MKRQAVAIWKGGLKDGKGSLSTESSILKNTPYSFADRFGEGGNTNPEELLAAAHAGCFAMALSNELESMGIKPESLEANVTITLDKDGAGFAITESHIDLKASIPGADQEKFSQAVEKAKTGCPVSKLYNTKITLMAKLN